MTPQETSLAQRVRQGHDRAVADLDDLVRLPSVSADPAHAEDVHACAVAVAALASDAGADRVDVLAVDGGQPAVVAGWHGPAGAPRVLLYAHHDVQPAPAAGWTSDPFTPVQRDGRLYGRGAADDKAGVVGHLAAIRAHDGRPPVGVTLFVEGEEEIGSPTFEAFLATHADRLAADVIVVADSMNWSTHVPALTTSLRGLVDCVIEVATLREPVHSGLGGGAAPDALSALARTLASLHHPDGSVAVSGLVQDHLEGPDLDEEQWRADTGVLDGVRLLGRGPLTDRLWRSPSVSVLALDAPRVADAANVLLPRARAVVSLRLAPGQDPAAAMAALRRHLEEHAPWGAHVTVTEGASGHPTTIDTSSPAAAVARGAWRDAFGGAEPVDIGIGGSIPFIAVLAEAYPQAAVLVTGAGDPRASWHGLDENLHLGMFERTCLAEALLLQRLAAT